jgi:hypothetical protein
MQLIHVIVCAVAAAVQSHVPLRHRAYSDRGSFFLLFHSTAKQCIGYMLYSFCQKRIIGTCQLVTIFCLYQLSAVSQLLLHGASGLFAYLGKYSSGHTNAAYSKTGV